MMMWMRKGVREWLNTGEKFEFLIYTWQHSVNRIASILIRVIFNVSNVHTSNILEAKEGAYYHNNEWNRVRLLVIRSKDGLDLNCRKMRATNNAARIKHLRLKGLIGFAFIFWIFKIKKVFKTSYCSMSTYKRRFQGKILKYNWDEVHTVYTQL